MVRFMEKIRFGSESRENLASNPCSASFFVDFDFNSTKNEANFLNFEGNY